MPAVPMIRPPVGKSGPLTKLSRSSPVASGLSMRWITPAAISRRLCGGMFVVMPTAIPVAPLMSRFGMRAGRTVVVRDHVDGLLLDVRHQVASDCGQPGLGVAHGRWRVAVDAAEVALPIYQRIAQR